MTSDGWVASAGEQLATRDFDTLSQETQRRFGANDTTLPPEPSTPEALVQNGTVLDTRTVTLEQSFEIVNASFEATTGACYCITFAVQNTGDLPVGCR